MRRSAGARPPGRHGHVPLHGRRGVDRGVLRRLGPRVRRRTGVRHRELITSRGGRPGRATRSTRRAKAFFVAFAAGQGRRSPRRSRPSSLATPSSAGCSHLSCVRGPHGRAGDSRVGTSAWVPPRRCRTPTAARSLPRRRPARDETAGSSRERCAWSSPEHRARLPARQEFIDRAPRAGSHDGRATPGPVTRFDPHIVGSVSLLRCSRWSGTSSCSRSRGRRPWSTATCRPALHRPDWRSDVEEARDARGGPLAAGARSPRCTRKRRTPTARSCLPRARSTRRGCSSSPGSAPRRSSPGTAFPSSRCRPASVEIYATTWQTASSPRSTRRRSTPPNV